MPLDLPAPLPAYFAAKNAHDIDAMLACFAQDAAVRDEGKDYHGHPAIRGWIEETTRKYKVTVEPNAVDHVGEEVAVKALVSGDFPGSPATLGYRFTIADGKIAAWKIG
ncbi:MAG: nuclear transport factor 2 family protein [Pseudolabrys sp.]|nr:nuclear transport factor 2 family protein [Pseudolabrys sp.]